MENIKSFNEHQHFWNGFFDLNNIKDDKTLKQLFKDALSLSYDHHVDKLVGFYRKKTDKLTTEEFIEQKLSLNNDNVVIDRFVYSGYKEYDKHGEIGSASKDNFYLFLYVSYDDLYDLVEKYNLPKLLK